MRTSLVTLAAFIVVACQPAAQQATSSSATTDASPSTAATATSDPDVAAVGATGLPAGYRGVPDRADADLSTARYAASGNGWDITTGPAHILFRPRDAATGNYTISTTIEQRARPRHPEAFGLFFGGQNLESAARSYTYFLVRGTGEMFARRKESDALRGLIAWQRSPNVPTADSAGRATYRIAVQVTRDSMHFRVNDVQVAALPKQGIPTDGVFGLRINHNLSLRATPVVLTR